MCQKFTDHSGKKFGILTVIEMVGKRGKHTLWKCICKCGREKVLCPSNFKCTKSCGCLKALLTSQRCTHNLMGRVFGLWRVLGRDESHPLGGNVRWLCRCVCGEERSISGTRLHRGKSSGCNSCSLKGKNLLDLTGQRLGPWTPLAPSESKNGQYSWKCRHEDGREQVVSANVLREIRDPQNKISRRYRKRVYGAFKEQSCKKSGRTFDLVGCSGMELSSYLSERLLPGMTLENYGKWHIDHVVPIASFDLMDPKQAKKCFHYTNLQPLWAKDNLSKGAKMPPSGRIHRSSK